MLSRHLAEALLVSAYVCRVPTYVECLCKDVLTHALKEELLVSAYVCRVRSLAH